VKKQDVVYDTMLLKSGGYYSAVKRNEIPLHATVWMNHENTPSAMLRERSQSRKDKDCLEKVLEIVVRLHNTGNVINATELYTLNGSYGKFYITYILPHLFFFF